MRVSPSPRAVAVSAVLALCLGTALIVAVGWTVGNNLKERQPVAAASASGWDATRGMLTTATESDVRALRAQGWTLPTLAADGFSVVSMVRGEVAGQPVVAITLDNDQDTVHIVEQRGQVSQDNPVDGVTGLPVSAEGLEPAPIHESHLWVLREQPWRAVLAQPDVVYTVTSDAPPATLSRTLTLVAAEQRGPVTVPRPSSEGFAATVLEGLREIFR